MPRISQRCPHCSSPKIHGDSCAACGRKVTEQPDFPRLEGLEHTELEARAGAKRAAAEAPAATRVVCKKCSVPNPKARDLCLACGERL